MDGTGRSAVAVVEGRGPVSDAWLTSDESVTWNEPRRVVVEEVRSGSGGAPDMARLALHSDAAPGRWLLASSETSARWVEPAPGAPVRVLVCVVDRPDEVWPVAGPVVPPGPPSARCLLVAGAEEARRLAERPRGGW